MRALFVDPGRLRARVRLEVAIGLSDGQGGVIEDWQPVASLWARMEPRRSDPRETAGALAAAITHRVTIRYRDDVSHAMRFVHRGRNLLIRSARDPDETRRYLICECEEVEP